MKPIFNKFSGLNRTTNLLALLPRTNFNLLGIGDSCSNGDNTPDSD